MAFRKVGSGKFRYVKYAECEAGQVLAEGYYLGTRDGQYGIQHEVQEDREVAVLNSSGHLNWLLENNVSRGDKIRVIYSGMEVLEKGKFKNKEAHRFDLEVDDSDRIAVKQQPKRGNDEEDSSEDSDASEKVDDSNSGRGRTGGLASRAANRGLSGVDDKSTRGGRPAGGTGGFKGKSASSAEDEGQTEEAGGEEEGQENSAQEEKLKEAQDVITKYRSRRT